MNQKDFDTGQDIIAALESGLHHIAGALNNLKQHPERLRASEATLHRDGALNELIETQQKLTDAMNKLAEAERQNAAMRDVLQKLWDETGTCTQAMMDTVEKILYPTPPKGECL
jgi:hypothetical protein